MSVLRNVRVLWLPCVAAVVLAHTIAGETPLDPGTAVSVLESAAGATDHEQVAAALDALRTRGPGAAPAAQAVSGLLAHQSKLYADRDKALVARLRAYAIVTLGDIGYPSEALPALFDTLAHVDERGAPVEVGAAAHAVGTLGARGRPFLPYLTELLTLERFAVEEFSLQRYEPLFPAAEATTVQLEAIHSLGRIASSTDPFVLSALGSLTAGTDARVRAAAQRAVSLIARRKQP